MSELAGIFVGAKRIKRTAKKLGAAIAADEIAHVEEKPGPSDIMYAGVDGTGSGPATGITSLNLKASTIFYRLSAVRCHPAETLEPQLQESSTTSSTIDSG